MFHSLSSVTILNALSFAITEDDKKSTTQGGSGEIDMSKYKNDPKYACTYMEIPQNDINKAERDFGLFGTKAGQASPGKDSG